MPKPPRLLMQSSALLHLSRLAPSTERPPSKVTDAPGAVDRSLGRPQLEPGGSDGRNSGEGIDSIKGGAGFKGIEDGEGSEGCDG